jgi:uncharacterized protein
VFVKAPRAGGVKTRLAVDLGPDVSAAVYRALAEAEIDATRPRGAEYERLFLFTPAEAREEMAAWLPGETLAAQDGSDLGARMAAAFEMAFERGADQVAIIGTDVPWVSRDTVGQAFAALSAADVAIGPCQDGGYYLLALSQPRPELFSGIAWSTSTVCAATLDRTRELGLRSRLLGTLPDVDTLADLRQAWDELRPLLPPAVAALLEPRLR